MEHCVRFGADGFSERHSGGGDGALLAELRNALHSHPAAAAAASGSVTSSSSATPSGQRAPAFLHICTKPPVGRPDGRERGAGTERVRGTGTGTGTGTNTHALPPMWSLSQYHAACKELDRCLLAQQRPEYLTVLLGLFGWCALQCAGRAYSAQSIWHIYTHTNIHSTCMHTHTHAYTHTDRQVETDTHTHIHTCTLYGAGSAEAALLISALAVVYGVRVYLRTAFRMDAVRAGSKAWLHS
jgi:hypothetical protein